MLDYVFSTFVTLFVVIDPIGMAPLFIGLTTGTDVAHQRRMAWRGVLISAGILFAFMATGGPILAALGVSLSAFRIAGGLLLFLLAVDMVLARQSGLRSTTGEEQREALHHPDISVFPLAIPLIAGPGALTSVLLLLGRSGPDYQVALLCGVLAAVLLLLLLTLLFATQLTRVLGLTGTNVVSRVLGIVLAALAVQYVLDGLSAAGVTG